ncbi:MAG: DUF5615 family PIN-like protein [Bacteroidia bacterium]
MKTFPFVLINDLNQYFPGCHQVRQSGLENKGDNDIWLYARENSFTIVTHDSDFYEFSTLKGHPPKIIWLRTGNTSTKNLISLIMEKKEIIKEFIISEKYKEVSCLEIE